jgi:isopentenyl diphosphate isomerase/L-lactate dehydrogenase-like FMN-dependent dehydrogenase
MREEIETAMRLLGVTSLEQLKPELLRYTGPDLLAKL